jgi:hypothetical protein
LPHHPSVPNQAIPLKEPLKADKSALNLLYISSKSPLTPLRRLKNQVSLGPFSHLAVEMARYAPSQVGSFHLLVPLEPDNNLVPKIQEC